MILLSYAKFPVFYAEYSNTEFFGGLGLFHSVHITVDSFYFGFGQVHFLMRASAFA